MFILIVVNWYHIEFVCIGQKYLFYRETFLSIFSSQLLSLLTDKLRSCLSSVCWPEAVSSPSCQSGRLCSSVRLLAAIRWLVSHLFLSYTLKILQTSSNCLLEACQVPNVGKSPPPPSVNECQEWHLPHKQIIICERKKQKQNRPLCTNCHLLFLMVLFGTWAHFRKHTDPPHKMKIITNLTKPDKVKQSNNVFLH